MEKIKDLKIYNERMQKGLVDKIWFLDHAKFDTLVDFGCADGSLMALVHDINPSIGLCGVENNPEMAALARENCPSAVIYSSFGWCTPHTLVNMSSVIHEMFTYDKDPWEDIDNIFESGAQYIAIRDMFWSDDYNRVTPNEDYWKVVDKEYGYKITSFTANHGTIQNYKNFIHYLLKYRYVENWEREVKENYFPISLEEFLEHIPNTYEIVHLEHYTLPFIKQKVKEDFDVDIDVPTHAKILLKKVG